MSRLITAKKQTFDEMISEIMAEQNDNIAKREAKETKESNHAI